MNSVSKILHNDNKSLVDDVNRDTQQYKLSLYVSKMHLSWQLFHLDFLKEKNQSVFMVFFVDLSIFAFKIVCNIQFLIHTESNRMGNKKYMNVYKLHTNHLRTVFV